MTRDEENRKLAEWIEPYEALPSGDHLEADYRVADTSPKEAWILDHVIGRSGMYYPEWIPRDFCTDEAASALLLEKMPHPVLCLRAGSRDWLCDPDTETNSVLTATHADRKTAIALAALQLIDGKEKA